ncbi:hypothetical protein K2P47_01895 [Patescibacteria group bacterium]|nr:hypothetical protein [Patescibacteria group bacterium]
MSTAYAVPESAAYGHIVTESEAVVAAETNAHVHSNTEAIVRDYFKDIPVMIQVARCESTFRHTLADGSVLQGLVDNADTGVMQINKRYHLETATSLGLDLYDIYDNMAYARHLYEKQGLQPWSASSPCWGQTLAMNTQ